MTQPGLGARPSEKRELHEEAINIKVDHSKQDQLIWLRHTQLPIPLSPCQFPDFFSLFISNNFNTFPVFSIIAEDHQRLPKITEDCRRLPKIAEDSQRSQKIAEDRQRLPKIAKYHQRSPMIAKDCHMPHASCLTPHYWSGNGLASGSAWGYQHHIQGPENRVM